MFGLEGFCSVGTTFSPLKSVKDEDNETLVTSLPLIGECSIVISAVDRTGATCPSLRELFGFSRERFPPFWIIYVISLHSWLNIGL